MDIRRHFGMAICAALFVWGGTATAQEANKGMPTRAERHYKPMPLSPEKSARHTTDRMDSLLDLTKKQYGKLYKLNLKWAREDAKNRTPAPRMGTVRPKAWQSTVRPMISVLCPMTRRTWRNSTGSWKNSAKNVRRS